VSTLAEDNENLICYRFESKHIVQGLLQCNIMVKRNSYESELIKIHNVTFSQQSVCSVEMRRPRSSFLSGKKCCIVKPFFVAQGRAQRDLIDTCLYRAPPVANVADHAGRGAAGVRAV
jgi:hypothetical protein